MNLDCLSCEFQLENYLCSIPHEWRKDIVSTLCHGDFSLSCKEIKKCEITTSLSHFNKEGKDITIKFTDELGKVFIRKFSFSSLFPLLSDIDSKCIMPQYQWNNLSYKNKISALLAKHCECCPPLVTTTTTTTETTTTSTSTTTTQSPYCKTYLIENNSINSTSITYTACIGEKAHVIIDGEQSDYICTLDTLTNIGNLTFTLIDSNCNIPTTTTTERPSANFIATADNNFQAKVISIIGVDGFTSSLLTAGQTQNGIHYEFTGNTISLQIFNPSIYDSVDILINNIFQFNVPFSSTGLYQFTLTVGLDLLTFHFRNDTPTTTTTTTSSTTTTTTIVEEITINIINDSIDDLTIKNVYKDLTVLGNYNINNGDSDTVTTDTSTGYYGIRILNTTLNLYYYDFEIVHDRGGTPLFTEIFGFSNPYTTVYFSSPFSMLNGDKIILRANLSSTTTTTTILPCRCYNLESSDGYIEYLNCNNVLVTKFIPSGISYLCAQENTITLLSGVVILFGETTDCNSSISPCMTTTTTTIPPCMEYTIAELGINGSTYNYSYTSCEGVPTTFSGVVGDNNLPLVVCAQNESIVTEGGCTSSQTGIC